MNKFLIVLLPFLFAPLAQADWTASVRPKSIQCSGQEEDGKTTFTAAVEGSVNVDNDSYTKAITYSIGGQAPIKITDSTYMTAFGSQVEPVFQLYNPQFDLGGGNEAISEFTKTGRLDQELHFPGSVTVRDDQNNPRNFTVECTMSFLPYCSGMFDGGFCERMRSNQANAKK